MKLSLADNSALQDGDDGLPGYLHAMGNLAVVDSQAPQPQNLSVIGHLVTSLRCIRP